MRTETLSKNLTFVIEPPLLGTDNGVTLLWGRLGGGDPMPEGGGGCLSLLCLTTRRCAICVRFRQQSCKAIARDHAGAYRILRAGLLLEQLHML